jgi:transposase
LSFADDTAERLGVSARTVERIVDRADELGEETLTATVKRERLRPTFATRQSKAEASGGSTTGLLRGEERWNTDPLLTFKPWRI